MKMQRQHLLTRRRQSATAVARSVMTQRFASSIIIASASEVLPLPQQQPSIHINVV